MTKQELKNSLEGHVNGLFITRGELAKALGYSNPHSVDKYLKDLPKVSNKYLISDVVDQMVEHIKR